MSRNKKAQGINKSSSKFLTAQELARDFGVSETTIYRLAKKSELPGIKIGDTWRFSKKEIGNWIRQAKEKSHGKKGD